MWILGDIKCKFVKQGKELMFFFGKYNKVYLMEIFDDLILLIENMLCSIMYNLKFKWI